MALTLYYHPLASFCWKVLLALYENQVPFTPHLVNHSDPESLAAFRAVWPMAKMPVLQDGERMVPETSIILEYLDYHHRGPVRLFPDDADGAREVRLADRFFDQYVQQPMQKIVGDRIRPAESRDPFGVKEARATLELSCEMVDRDMATRQWACGVTFSMADCSAAPALFYANKVMLLAGYPNALAYLERLQARPSMQRVLAEAEPYFQYFPEAD